MALPYTKKVLEYFMHPKNVGEIKNPDAVATLGSPACGDMITTYLRVNPKTLVVEDVKFKSYGCAANIATASVISEKAKGRTVHEILAMDTATAARELGGLPPVKMHCSVLAVNTLKKAIKEYMVAKGIWKKEEVPLTQDAILSELLNVVNPEIGLDIVRLKMVENIRIDNGEVEVTIRLGTTDEMFAQAIKEEVEEELRELQEVKKVTVIVKK
ncbi:MAG: iron-sulfur cluster assembly scaffold protein [Candidatus Micrarchaeia archaeon]